MNNNLNIPNALTALRIVLVPFVAAMFATGHLMLATVLFLVAGATDILDGFIARRFNLVTNVGKVLDPIADKGMSLTVIICMWHYARIMPAWAVVVFVSKELLMFLVGAVLLAEQIIIPARWYGKASTAVTTASVVILMCANGFSIPMSAAAQQILIAFAALFAVFALIMYLLHMIKVIRSQSQSRTDIT